MTEFKYAPMFQLGEDQTEYYKIPGSEQYAKLIKRQNISRLNRHWIGSLLGRDRH